MRGTGVKYASRVTCKMRRKDARTEQPKNKRRCWLSVKSALKEDWVKSVLVFSIWSKPGGVHTKGPGRRVRSFTSRRGVLGT
jgi:hypothetical protein